MLCLQILEYAVYPRYSGKEPPTKKGCPEFQTNTHLMDILEVLG